MFLTAKDKTEPGRRITQTFDSKKEANEWLESVQYVYAGTSE